MRLTILSGETGQEVAYIDDINSRIIGFRARKIDNTFSIVVYDELGLTYNAEWSEVYATFTQFIGFSLELYGPIDFFLDANNIIKIPQGINFDKLYTRWSTELPIQHRFEVVLYTNTAENNRVDKTDYISEVSTELCNLKNSTSITNPILIMNLTSISPSVIPYVNYAYIKPFGRYYFIDDIKILSNGVYELSLSIDVLYTHRNKIYEMKGFIDRNEFEFNNNLIDKKGLVVNQGIDVNVVDIPNDVIYPWGTVPGVGEPVYIICGYKISAEPQGTSAN